MITRRTLIRGLGATLLCAPAIVRASSLMAVKPLLDQQAYLVQYGDSVINTNIYDELVAVTKRAFVPKLYMRVYETSPFLKLVRPCPLRLPA